MHLIKLLLLSCVAAIAQANSLSVYFSAPAAIYEGELFSVGLKADLPEPVLGWGLEIVVDSRLTLIGAEVDSAWFPVATTEYRLLSGLAFPSPISGHGTSLATLTFMPLQPGLSRLDGVATGTYPTEGFILSDGQFAQVRFVSSQVLIKDTTDVPEPNTGFIGPILLFTVGVATIMSRIKC